MISTFYSEANAPQSRRILISEGDEGDESDRCHYNAGRDGQSVSRDQILRREQGQEKYNFPCSAEHKQDWQPYPVDPYSPGLADQQWVTIIRGFWRHAATVPAFVKIEAICGNVVYVFDLTLVPAKNRACAQALKRYQKYVWGTEQVVSWYAYCSVGVARPYISSLGVMVGNQLLIFKTSQGVWPIRWSLPRPDPLLIVLRGVPLNVAKPPRYIVPWIVVRPCIPYALHPYRLCNQCFVVCCAL